MDIAITMLAALILDHLFGEPRCWHPLIGFGKLTQFIERLSNNKEASNLTLKIRGGISLSLLVFPLTIFTAYVSYNYNTYFLFDSFILYLVLGARSLVEHAQRVIDALQLKRLKEARTLVGHLVSRDTDKMTETDMSRATIESTLENGNDAIFAPLFWFAVGGAPAAVFYRLSNTLDAMWGYRTTRYLYFGRTAARLDDIVNYIPARLTAITYACLGHFQTALQCWRAQAYKCKSPNGGPVMSSGAGALALQLGGPTYYHGKLEDYPIIGCGEIPDTSDIMQATRLVQRGTGIWLLIAWLMVGGYTLA